MKNIQLTQRETDLKVLAVMAKAGAFFIIGGIAWLFTLLSWSSDYQLPFINFVLSIAAALFAWSIYHLVAPRRYSRDWQIAGLIFIPAVWLLLVLAGDVGIHSVIQSNQFQLEEFSTPTL
jgi:hypothetical protein